MTYYAPVSLPFPWQGKFLPCQPQDFSLLAMPSPYAQASVFKEILDQSTIDVQPEMDFFPYFPVRQGKTARVREPIRSCALGSCEMHPQADIVGVTDEDRTAG
jgi:hypothetical protein